MSSEKLVEQQSCLRKRRFAQWGQARAFAHIHGQTPYACRFCGEYHVASLRGEVDAFGALRIARRSA